MNIYMISEEETLGFMVSAVMDGALLYDMARRGTGRRQGEGRQWETMSGCDGESERERGVTEQGRNKEGALVARHLASAWAALCHVLPPASGPSARHLHERNACHCHACLLTIQQRACERS